ncbi:MAG: phosphoglucosamine mutase [Anaerorhabdus sp.]
MGKYFGTDGIRGEANKTLDAQRAFLLGRYLGYYYQKNGNGKIIIGKDTRLSSSMFESALAAGITSQGCNVYLLNYCPTPAIAYLVTHKDFDCGAMISASHNPYYDNGIKVFDNTGIKISSELENEIEEYLDGKCDIEYKTHQDIGQIISYSQGLEVYLDWLESSYKLNLRGMKIVIDCANGSASTTAYQLLSRFNAEIVVLNNDPNGININEGCGSTHPECLQKATIDNKADIGFAFDGDADRLIACDNMGNLVTGDHILYVCSKYKKANNTLVDNTLVTTVMANLGLFKALEKEDIKTTVTAVGDKYVYESMNENGFVLGGEQSGHIIFSDKLSTGDGLLSALELLLVMNSTNKKMSELVDGLLIFPQLLINVKVSDKNEVMNLEELKEVIADVNNKLGDNGRLLVRPSGTEPIVRVMVEAENEELCSLYANEVVSVIMNSQS